MYCDTAFFSGVTDFGGNNLGNLGKLRTTGDMTLWPNGTISDGLIITTTSVHPEVDAGLDLGIDGTNDWANIYSTGTAKLGVVQTDEIKADSVAGIAFKNSAGTSLANFNTNNIQFIDDVVINPGNSFACDSVKENIANTFTIDNVSGTAVLSIVNSTEARIEDNLNVGPSIQGIVNIGRATTTNGQNYGLKIQGDNATTNGAGIELYTDADAYPTMQLFNYSHNGAGILFDAFYQNSSAKWLSSNLGSNFMIYKQSDLLRFCYNSGTAADGTTEITNFNASVAMEINSIGDVNIKNVLEIESFDDGSANALWFDNSSWAVYLSRDAKTSPTGGTTASYGDVTDFALRFAVGANSTYGFIWEDDAETALMSLSAVNGNLTIKGNTTVNGDLIASTKTPASASATGTTGTIAWDASYIYVCTATNTWKRAAIATW